MELEEVEIDGYIYVVTKEPPIEIDVMDGVDVVFVTVSRQSKQTRQRRYSMIFPDVNSAMLWISDKQKSK